MQIYNIYNDYIWVSFPIFIPNVQKIGKIFV
jgi:hypothetical protein